VIIVNTEKDELESVTRETIQKIALTITDPEDIFDSVLGKGDQTKITLQVRFAAASLKELTNPSMPHSRVGETLVRTYRFIRGKQSSQFSIGTLHHIGYHIQQSLKVPGWGSILSFPL